MWLSGTTKAGNHATTVGKLNGAGVKGLGMEMGLRVGPGEELRKEERGGIRIGGRIGEAGGLDRWEDREGAA